jgi:23S rRNA (uracil1939-C5)-methyltransferase
MMYSPVIIEPKCRHFGVCGGCKLQHIPYEVQLEHKEALVRSCFGRETEPILAAQNPWHYRNKMEFSFSQARNGEKFLGLMKPKRRVENLEECHLAGSWFLEALKNVRGWWYKSGLNAYHPPTNQGLLRTLTLREGIHSGEKMALLTLSDAPFEEVHLSTFTEALPNVDALILRRQIVQKKTPTRFEEQVLRGKDHIHEILHDASGHPFRFRIRGASFFQPNTLQAEVIYQKALQWASLKEQESLLDLYCGTGSLGILASRSVSCVLGIEIVREAVHDARANLALNDITNMEILEGDVGDHLDTLSFSPTTIFVDPPRAGLGGKTIAQLLKQSPEKIVYVSCNPMTQAADCRALKGYEILGLQPIDQFPQTPHVENIALLKKQTPFLP